MAFFSLGYVKTKWVCMCYWLVRQSQVRLAGSQLWMLDILFYLDCQVVRTNFKVKRGFQRNGDIKHQPLATFCSLFTLTNVLCLRSFLMEFIFNYLMLFLYHYVTIMITNVGNILFICINCDDDFSKVLMECNINFIQFFKM